MLRNLRLCGVQRAQQFLGIAVILGDDVRILDV